VLWLVAFLQGKKEKSIFFIFAHVFFPPLRRADGDIPKLPSLALRNLKNSKLYLEAFPENELVLKKLRQYVETFVSSYYIV
jgi:hypothetical protein